MAPVEVERAPRESPDTDPPDRRLPGEEGKAPVREPVPRPFEPQREPDPDAEDELDETGPLELPNVNDDGVLRRLRETEAP